MPSMLIRFLDCFDEQKIYLAPQPSTRHEKVRKTMRKPNRTTKRNKTALVRPLKTGRYSFRKKPRERNLSILQITKRFRWLLDELSN